ncbi:protein kinase domain-containing protein [Schlesneria paludicola]|uniref:protein kinase domain-containing protein n=1 Tax=Schlesneria paludicola TaxID=360056 RepID=UPI00029A0FF3|nr:protein kinase [Schlesneria paludicola]
MSDDTVDSKLIEAWSRGDERAATILFERYHVRLTALIKAKLSRQLARRIDPEDILLSAYRSFFITSRDRRSLTAANDDLWPLLATFVLRKLARQVRYHHAGRRSVAHEQAESSAGMESVWQREPTAEHAAVFLEEVERLMKRLDETAREVVVLTLQGYDAPTIAGQLGLNERTVRRALERVRALLPIERADGMGSPQVSLSVAPGEGRVQRDRVERRGTTTYDQFVLQQFVGSGAFSKVYRAIERASGQTVAVKFLRKECWTDTRAIEALIREYDLLRQLNHHKILAIRSWGTTPRGALFLVTDFISGTNLAEWRQHTKPGVKRILEVVRDVTLAVGAAHARQIFHGDLKPANVMLKDDGQIVLCDFGLARYASDPDDVPRGGTAGFLAPEQISDVFGSLSAQTDVYGIGAMLFALLVGQPPMTGRDLPETLANVLSASVPKPASSYGVVTPPGLDEFLLRCLQKEPSQRFASVDEVLQALDAIPSD